MMSLCYVKLVFISFAESEGFGADCFMDVVVIVFYFFFFGAFIWGQVGGFRFYWLSIYKYIIFFSIKLSASQLY